ncbi:hypothetical protein [Polyangium sp. 6x1]|uniref:hypothetical protein n=1 Tax=Polyangium sp. 6x1 TaxID=3042689 RepID=UPI00248272D3|nr:hypothetical protein [Polyangium sp. 6x1]MDI1447187.1 hypothetical protein [Polyangium sp. 6x1]
MEPGKTKRKKQSEATIQIRLRKPYRQLVLGLVLFGACAAFFFYRSMTNDRGLILNGVIHFGPDGADVFYAVMGLLCALMGGAALFSIHSFSKVEPFELVLGARSLSLPVRRTMGTQMTTVSIRDIVSVGMYPHDAPKSIVVQASGESYWIQGNWLPEGWTVQDLNRELVKRLRRQEEEPAAGAE